MQGNKKKWPLSLLALMLAMGGTLAACSSKGPEGKAGDLGSGSDSKYDKLPKNVSISMFDRGQVSSDEGTYEENRWVKWIREQSGINVKIVPVPRGQAQEKLNVLVAAGEAPDLIWEFDRKYIGTLVTQGVVQPIDEYIEKYSTSYKKYLQENPDLKPYLTFDGKMYAVATKRPITDIANHGAWIRQDWLDKLGLKTPTTLDELLEVAKAFKERDPDGNGKADTIAIVGGPTNNSESIYAAWHGTNGVEWFLEEGKLKYAPTTDRFADVISLLKKVYDQGLIDKEYLTDKNNQRANQAWTTGKAGILLFQWGGGALEGLHKDLLKNVPDAKPVPMESVSTKYGKFGMYQEASPLIYVAFNKSMKNPKAAVEYLDWIVDKGWKSLKYGTEGVHYKMVNGVPQTIDADKYKKEVLYANEYAVLRQEQVKAEDLAVRAASDALSQQIAKQLTESLKVAFKNKYRRDIPYQPNIAEINEVLTQFNPIVNEIKAKAVLEGKGADWAIGEIRKEWKRLGGDKAEALAQQWYDQNKASFK